MTGHLKVNDKYSKTSKINFYLRLKYREQTQQFKFHEQPRAKGRSWTVRGYSVFWNGYPGFSHIILLLRLFKMVAQ